MDKNFALTFEDFRRIIGQQEIEKYLTAQERDKALAELAEIKKSMHNAREQMLTGADKIAGMSVTDRAK